MTGIASILRSLTAADLVSYKHSSASFPPIVSVRADEPVRKAASLMIVYGLSRLPVGDDGTYHASLTPTAIIAGMSRNPDVLDQPVSKIAEKPLEIIPATMEYSHIADRFSGDSGMVLVSDGEQVIGILAAEDLLSPFLSGGCDEYVI